MAEGDDFERRLMISVDVKGYSGSTAHQQARIQAGLLTVLDRAADRAGLSRSTWKTQSAGDGELSVLPPTEPEPRVVDDFVRHLSAELRRHNRDQAASKRLRLRLAVHYGPAIAAMNGYSGAGPTTVSRLCDSAPLRAALDQSGAALVVILSERVFSETIAQEHTSLEPSMFRKVCVRVKEFVEDAWIWVPDHDIHDLVLAGTEPADGDPDGGQSSAAAKESLPPQASQARGNFHGAQLKGTHKVVGGDEIHYYGGAGL